MARETKAAREARLVKEAVEAGYDSMEEYEASLKAGPVDSDSDSEGDSQGRRDLAPETLGFVSSEVQDVPADELPNFGLRDSKYAEYNQHLIDSFNKGELDGKFTAWKKSGRVNDPEALVDALRNAATRLKIGADIRMDKDEATLEPNGYVYFCARPVREKKSSTSTEG
jgi:hypothetical protein